MNTFRQSAQDMLPCWEARGSCLLMLPGSLAGFPRNVNSAQYPTAVCLVACLPNSSVTVYTAFIAFDVSDGGMYATDLLV